MLVAGVLVPLKLSVAFVLPSQTPEDVQRTHGFPLLPLLPTSFKRSTLWQAWQDERADPNLHDGLCPGGIVQTLNEA